MGTAHNLSRFTLRSTQQGTDDSTASAGRVAEVGGLSEQMRVVLEAQQRVLAQLASMNSATEKSMSDILRFIGDQRARSDERGGTDESGLGAETWSSPARARRSVRWASPPTSTWSFAR